MAVIAVVALLGCAGNINPSRQIDDAALATSVRDALWVVGFSGLTGTTVLLMRVAAQALHARIVGQE